MKTYRKTALMRAVQFDGTEESVNDIIVFMAQWRGALTTEDGEVIGRRTAGIVVRGDDLTPYVVGHITPEHMDAHKVLFEDPEVQAVVWNDLHKYWNPLRVTDHVALDAHGCFYCISNTDVIASYTEVDPE